MDLIPSHAADIIFTHDISAAIHHLGFDPINQGRALALFRNPVERLVSKFYYLQNADWESGYRPHWKNITVVQWAESDKNYAESNYMVQMLSGKPWTDPVTQDDLPRAKQLLRDHFIVGLLDHIEESFTRFNIVMSRTRKRGNPMRQQTLASECMKEVLQPEDEDAGTKSNRHEHDKVSSYDQLV